MVVSTAHDMRSFFLSMVLGICLCVMADMVRAVFSRVKNRSAADFAIWLSVGVTAFSAWLYFLGGEVRAYMLIAAFFTAIIYLCLLERHIFHVFLMITQTISYFFEIILKILLTPLKFLCKIIGKYVNRAKKKFFKKVEDEYEEKACDKA